MNNLGSGPNGQLTFLDIVSLISFYIGVENLNENLSQSDKQDLLADLHNNSKLLLDKLQTHLENQDKKLDLILARLEDKE
jgi:hypothetical protein